MSSIKIFSGYEFENYQPINGEVCGVLMEDGKVEYKIFNDNDGWQSIDVNNGNIQLNLLDINRQIISQLPELTEVSDKIELIDNFSKEQGNTFYMLYGKNISYFTVFMVSLFQSLETLGTEVINCLRNLGKIKLIEPDSNNPAAIECWIQEDGQEAEVLYLFPYDLGIIYVRG